MFGFFDAEDDPEVGAALIDAAEDWLRERGRERMLGPMDFTTNDECGVLIEGFDRDTADPAALAPARITRSASRSSATARRWTC